MRFHLPLALLAAASFGRGQEFHTVTFKTQNFHVAEWKTTERYGLNETKIMHMGHDAFVKWYCDPSRAGNDARVQAEKVYCFAVTECNAPYLEKLSRKEQLFMEGVFSAYADMAKSSFVLGIMGSSEGDEWSLPIAETSTAISEAIHALVNPKFVVPPHTNLDLEPLYVKVAERVKAKHPQNAAEAGRLRFVVEYAEKLFKGRSARDKIINRIFAERMVQVAMLTPTLGQQ